MERLKALLDKTQPKVKTFRELKTELAKDSSTHHHVRLVCVKCSSVNTCRCSQEKTTYKGICDTCASL